MRVRHRSLLCIVVMTAATAGAVRLLAQDSAPHVTTQPLEPPIVLPTSPADIDRGRVLYGTHCASCHGLAGEGGKGPTLAQPMLARASRRS